MAPSEWYIQPPVRPSQGYPPDYLPCSEGHPSREGSLGPVLAREDVRTAMYHLWSPEGGAFTAGCAKWKVCGTEKWPWGLPDEFLGATQPAALIPNDRRCNSYQWPLYFERKIQGLASLTKTRFCHRSWGAVAESDGRSNLLTGWPFEG